MNVNSEEITNIYNPQLIKHCFLLFHIAGLHPHQFWFGIDGYYYLKMAVEVLQVSKNLKKAWKNMLHMFTTLKSKIK